MLVERSRQLKRIHIISQYITENLIDMLLKNQRNLTALCLKSSVKLSNEKTVSLEKLIEISALVILEKIHFGSNLPVNDEVVTKIVQDCPNINEIKLGNLSNYFLYNIINE